MTVDIERIARDYLRSRGFACEFYVPDEIPASLVTLRRSTLYGSSRFRGRAMLTVQAWAETRGKASALCSEAVDAILGRGKHEGSGGLMAAEPNITGCSPENGPYRLDDPDVKDRKRWQATVAVTYNE